MLTVEHEVVRMTTDLVMTGEATIDVTAVETAFKEGVSTLHVTAIAVEIVLHTSADAYGRFSEGNFEEMGNAVLASVTGGPAFFDCVCSNRLGTFAGQGMFFEGTSEVFDLVRWPSGHRFARSVGVEDGGPGGGFFESSKSWTRAI